MKSRKLAVVLLSTTTWIAAGTAYAQQGAVAQAATSTQPLTSRSDETSAPTSVPDSASSRSLNPTTASTVNEVVVTALKQGTGALKTPATVSIVPAATLQQRNITTANHLDAVVPGLVMTIQSAGLPGVSFRGLGSNASIISLEPSVGLYQDGFYLGHSRDYASPIYDVDHLEFIKGTQSTLLGKNVSLGAISIVNRRPTDQFTWRANASHTEGIDGNKFDGGITIPISDALSVRIAGLVSEDNGYVQNLYLDRTEARDRELSGRLMVAFKLLTNVDGLFTYQHDERRLAGQNLQIVSDPTGTIARWATAYGVPYQAGKPDLSASAQRPLLGGISAADPFDHQDTDRINLILNAEVGPFKLTWQSGHIRYVSPRAIDGDFVPALLINQSDIEKDVETTHEVRVATDVIPRLKLLAGFFYYDDSWKLSRTVLTSPGVVRFPLNGSYTLHTGVASQSESVFASGTYSITDQVKLDAGVRYTHERKTGDFVRSSTGLLVSAAPNVPLTAYAPLITDPVDFNIGLRYEPTSWLLTYVTYAQASKSGGYQDAPTTVAGAAFLPETPTSVELGLKARLGRGSVAAAIFDTRIHNFQTTYTHAVGTPPVSQITIGNSEVDSRGVELSGSYNVLANLRLGAEIVYADSHFTQDFSTIARDGEALTRAPKVTGRFEAEYHTPIIYNLTGFAGAGVDFSTTTRYQFVTSQPTAPVGNAHQIVNARIGIRGRGDAWELALIGTNLTDERYITFDTSVTGGGGAYNGAFNQPRVIALQLSLKH